MKWKVTVSTHGTRFTFSHWRTSSFTWAYLRSLLEEEQLWRILDLVF